MSLTVKQFRSIAKKRRTKFLFVVFEPPEIVPDILWPQLRKTTERLKNILHQYEFSVHRYACWTDEKKLAVIMLEMEVWELPSVDEKIGPLIFDVKNSERFIGKYKNSKRLINGPYIRDNRWIVEVERGWKSAKEKLEDTLDENESILMAKGIPNFIAKQIAKKFKVMDEKSIERLIKTNKEFGRFLKEYFKMESLA